jgi:uncharacterized membrane protein YqiK
MSDRWLGPVVVLIILIALVLIYLSSPPLPAR